MRLITAIFFLSFFFCFKIFPNDISNFHFRRYQVSDGLSESTVTCIMQDVKGFLWLGTKDGLNKFDGVSFKTYRHLEENKKSLGNNFVKAIVEAEQCFYIGTDDGVYRMKLSDETFERLESRLGLDDKVITSVTSLILDKSGRLWITTMNQGVYVYNPQKSELTPIRSRDFELTNTNVWDVHEDKSGSIWIGTRVGLFQFNTNTNLFESVEGLVDFGNNTNKEILTIFEDEQGNFWLGTWSDGIIYYNKQSEYSAFCGPKSKDYYITHIRSFLQFDHSNLLVGSDDGLYLFNMDTKDLKRIDVPYKKNSLSDQNVYSLLRDKEGQIWIGTYFGGLNYLNTTVMSIENYLPDNQPGSLSGKAVSQFLEDKKGNLWIATEDGGLNYFDTKTKRFTQPISTSYHNLHPLLSVGDELWIGTFSRGLDIYNTKTKKLRNFRHANNDDRSINDDCIFSLYQAKNGDVYIGTTMGLNKFNPQQNNFERIKSDSIFFVYDIKEDSYNNLWVASYSNGIFKLNQKTGKWTNYNDVKDKGNPIVDAKLTGIFIDNLKRLWLSSEGRGIFMYNYEDDSFMNISEKEGLPNNVVYGITDDQLGNLWISCNKGLVSFKPFDLNNLRLYNQHDGLQSVQFNYKSSYKSRDGKLYFGGINGFNSFFPQDLLERKNKVIPQIEITNLKLLGNTDKEKEKYILESINNNKPIRLNHNNASFSISYVSLSYIAQAKNQYAYKLENVDADWNHVGNNRSVTYVNLAPGKYTFRVKASNNDNVWNEEGASLRFEIRPPFWLSIPAKILYVILLLLSAYSIVHFLIRKNKIKHQHLLESYKTEQESLAFKSKIDFFTNIAHEIRTPVSLIKAPLEEIIQSGDGNCDTRQNLLIIEKNSERLNTLINQLLDFRKMDSAKYFLKLNRMDLKLHIAELYDRFRKTVQNQGIEFELIMPAAREIEIISDSDALIKIIGNFLTNAIKHTKDKIVIQLVCNKDESYTISVTDNGKGIPNDQKAQIFDPFYQIKSIENKKGTGIGLYIAKQLADILGGSILIQDNPVGGSIFNFTFKSHAVEKTEEATDVESDPDLHDEMMNIDMNDKKHILIVEDNCDMLHFIENCLKNEYLPDIANSVSEAYRLMELKPYDLIIADIMMPEVDGIEFTQQLRNDINFSHIPIILLSAKTDNNTKIDGLNAGADVFIEKPFSTSYLKAQISSLLANRKMILEAFNRSPLTSYSILTTNKNDQDFLNRLNEEINKNISDSDFSIESLTDKLFISRSNLQRKLKAICGYSPGDYLKTYRLKKASQLLFEKGLRVNEVAYEVGFSSASYFTKCFVRQFGILPKDFVKENSK